MREKEFGFASMTPKHVPFEIQENLILNEVISPTMKN